MGAFFFVAKNFARYFDTFKLQIATIWFCFDKFVSLQFDLDRNGHITSTEIGTVMKSLGEEIPGFKLRDIIKEVDKNQNGTVEFEEFLEVSGSE